MEKRVAELVDLVDLNLGDPKVTKRRALVPLRVDGTREAFVDTARLGPYRGRTAHAHYGGVQFLVGRGVVGVLAEEGLGNLDDGAILLWLLVEEGEEVLPRQLAKRHVGAMVVEVEPFGGSRGR